MKAATVICLRDFQNNSRKVTRLKETTGMEAVVRREGEPEMTRIRGITETGMLVDLRLPYIPLKQCVDLMSAARPGDTVNFDHYQLKNEQR